MPKFRCSNPAHQGIEAAPRKIFDRQLLQARFVRSPTGNPTKFRSWPNEVAGQTYFFGHVGNSRPEWRVLPRWFRKGSRCDCGHLRAGGYRTCWNNERHGKQCKSRNLAMACRRKCNSGFVIKTAEAISKISANSNIYDKITGARLVNVVCFSGGNTGGYGINYVITNY